MNERLLLYRDKVKTMWDKLTKKQKLLIGASALFLLIALSLYLYIASRPVYVNLYDRLSEQEVGAIKQELEAKNIPYRLTGNGTGIEVPQTMAQDVIVDLAAQGIPKDAGISSEIFSNNMFGMTDRQFEVMKKDALQQEIRKILEKVKGVRTAQVILTMPEETTFVTDNTDKATASVMVEVDPSTQLNDAQIKSLYHIVSRSVKNLPVENITITDQYSNTLELAGKEEGSSMTAFEQQERIRNKVEREIQKNLFNMLSTIMGRDKVVVHTMVQMDFSKENRVENLVSPVVNDEGIIISSQKLSKAYTGQGTPPIGGVAGTGDNQVGSYQSATAQGSNSEYEELSDTVNREVNRITKNVTASPYQIVDISINVGVEPPNGGTLDDATKENIQKVIGNVVRVAVSNKNLPDDEVNKRISVFAKPFSGKLDDNNNGFFTPTMMYGVGAVALLALGALAFVLIRRRKQQEQEEVEFEEEFPFTPSLDIPDLSSLEDDTDEAMVRKQLEKLARSNPDEFVVLLRTWLAED
ncbi:MULTISPECIES: flagellar basal-body MS-ring/collar protein FliF [Brevibacillus]|uniref:Flagellar M-ring protein n=1 Tax=Brevibacillus laterosporus TaxID=1465 RepID=A0AAP3G6K8_BRELA|nr:MULTISPECIES: flagellar basal-body MS-ring/collar protein FliF [Brevibacillus]MCR8979277.1 flagellar basal-body MS-ring/collar protein FliF [Brevibacillus laterosporus]MCZ0806433.1 flagellar basal-body MS-ring/collar protein FliF [Brevibacillus laterosporus]MCZ0824832.1 flagellar basal-body MS-ring/collar protein FliF [Brevibacillus laterosporus]MCZ0848737.1 flagellar basal-body MS-ring/collar protein FliF [Brevibacillus laterosporus]MED1664665.1 flagellar basal-body MS-ring/collar protein 